MKRNNFLIGLVLILGFGIQSAMAQKAEIHPYAGGFFPGTWADSFKMKKEGIYGVRAGFFVADQIQLEGNLGYINHFKFEGTAPKSRAFVWDVGPSFNFLNQGFSKAVPYLSVGVGGVTGVVGKVTDIVATDPGDRVNLAPPGASPLILQDGDTFFQFNYGGGFKAINLWGPVGLRGDVRGRTLPNFFGDPVTWLEVSGGVTFTWGER